LLLGILVLLVLMAHVARSRKFCRLVLHLGPSK
jgi:hypothetical protein